ncbi:MAG: hypothetical protein N3A55_08505 [Methylohalobius sp.]|nr:hypothetical protein [Methylohalobius sp.]
MAFSEEVIQAVWEKGRAGPELDPTQWRQDQCGAWMCREHYNNFNSEFGWKILEVVPGGGEALAGLQPFHWQNTFDLEHRRPLCRVTADRSDVAAGQRVSQPRNINL